MEMRNEYGFPFGGFPSTDERVPLHTSVRSAEAALSLALDA